MDTRAASLRNVLHHLRATFAGYRALLLAGDLAMDGGAEAYRFLDGALPAQAVPHFILPGNHDDAAGMRTWLAGACAPAPAMVDLGDWRLLLLDTLIPPHSYGQLGAAQLEWLARRLGDGTAAHIAIVMYHPPVSIGSPWMDAMGLRDGTHFGRHWRRRARSGSSCAAIFTRTSTATAITSAYLAAPRPACSFDHAPRVTRRIACGPVTASSSCTRTGRCGLRSIVFLCALNR